MKVRGVCGRRSGKGSDTHSHFPVVQTPLGRRRSNMRFALHLLLALLLVLSAAASLAPMTPGEDGLSHPFPGRGGDADTVVVGREATLLRRAKRQGFRIVEIVNGRRPASVSRDRGRNRVRPNNRRG